MEIVYFIGGYLMLSAVCMVYAVLTAVDDPGETEN